MPVPVGTDTYVAAYLQELEDRIAALENPGSPRPEFSCLQANLPDATKYTNARGYVTDVKILVVSDGTVWRRQDTGAPV